MFIMHHWYVILSGAAHLPDYSRLSRVSLPNYEDAEASTFVPHIGGVVNAEISFQITAMGGHGHVWH
jgi:hypothetical protein